MGRGASGDSIFGWS
ncbi:unnamed protein product, partial [Rotaria sp. Silwood2]